MLLNIQGIEVDVHQVKDGFVIFHDFTLERLTGVKKEISCMSIEELNSMRLRGNHKIPTLSELLSLVDGKLPINLEIKTLQNYSAFIQILTNYIHQTNGQVILSSFNHFIIQQLQSNIRQSTIRNNLKFGALVAHLPLLYSHFSVELEVDIAAIDADLVNNNFVRHAHQHDKEVWCYTVNCPIQAKRLRDIGVDAIFSNDPELMLSELS